MTVENRRQPPTLYSRVFFNISGRDYRANHHKSQPSNQPIPKCRRLDAMSQYDVGDRVRIDIPDETDPDHEQYHGEHGHTADILKNGAGSLTGKEQDLII